MQVYLAKPGGKKEGPYTLDQVKQDLAARKYNDADFWAWHDGMPEWKPLYEIPGISPKSGSTTSASTAIAVENEEAELAGIETGETFSTASDPGVTTPAFEVSTPAESSPAPAEMPASRISSGRPFAALEHVFILTTGASPEIFQSQAICGMLQQTIGVSVGELRRAVPVDIIIKARTPAMQALCSGAVPDSVWRALAGIKAEISKQAQEGVFHLCLRTFPSEAEEVVALLAFYRKAE